MVGNRKLYIPLMGGLGNQLFQLSASHDFRSTHQLVIDCTLLSHMKSKDGTSVALNYSWGGVRILESNRIRWISQKIASLLIRIATARINPIAKGLILPPVRGIAKLFFSVRYGTWLNIVLPLEIGFEIMNINNSKSLMLLGYFQSPAWSRNSAPLILLNSRPGGELAGIHPERARSQKVLVVHVRLGDYRSEPDFGIVASSYYLTNLQNVFLKSECDEIWFFSNENISLPRYVPEELLPKSKYIDNSRLTDLEVFELMRLGDSYMIGNSTFSWWAAYSSYSGTPVVFYPAPWFKNLPPPSELFPLEWVPLVAEFE